MSRIYAPRHARYLEPCVVRQSPFNFRKDSTVQKFFVIAVALCGILIAHNANAVNGTPMNTGSANPLTLAVFGDWPYSQALLDAAPLLIDSINSDPQVRLVMHVGDIHSGSMPCTGAGLDPLPH